MCPARSSKHRGVCVSSALDVGNLTQKKAAFKQLPIDHITQRINTIVWKPSAEQKK